MLYYEIEGGNALFGEVDIQGSKNSALAIIFASLITDGISFIYGVPDISDIHESVKILSLLGCEIKFISRNIMRIDSRNVCYSDIPKELTKKLRASCYLIGALLSKFGFCPITESGGCNFGGRPLDYHISAMKSLSAEEKENTLICKNGLKGGTINLPFASVGATINIIIASCIGNYTTVINNAAREPHIVDLCSYLRNCGALIYGDGTNIIKIKGVKKLHSGNIKISKDMIEAGTYINYALITNGNIICKNAPFMQMHSYLKLLKNMGANLHIHNGHIKVMKSKLLSSSLETGPFPAFPTDLQPQTAVLFAKALGKSIINEKVFKNRFGYVPSLKKLGFKSDIFGSEMVVYGEQTFMSGISSATDLRGGAALISCALSAEGKSRIYHPELIMRGYSDFDLKLRKLGAKIKLIK